jgi:hypothetical protein
MIMAEYTVTLQVGPDQGKFIEQAYSPMEAAFLAGVDFGTDIVFKWLQAWPGDFVGLSPDTGSRLVLEEVRSMISAVLVEEERYAR